MTIYLLRQFLRVTQEFFHFFYKEVNCTITCMSTGVLLQLYKSLQSNHA